MMCVCVYIMESEPELLLHKADLGDYLEESENAPADHGQQAKRVRRRLVRRAERYGKVGGCINGGWGQ